MKKGDYIWGLLLLSIKAFLIIPATNKIFLDATQASPYLMGFLKFAVLASMGEFLAIRITLKQWKTPCGMAYKALVWGAVGILVVLMFQVFPSGVSAAAEKGYLFIGDGWYSPILIAFLTSIIMNFTFAPVFMAGHRITDAYIDARCQGGTIRLSVVIDKVDWSGFIKYVVGKTIPFFWIPMHTISFLLPGEYRVLWAAFLSVALGAILAYAKVRKI